MLAVCQNRPNGYSAFGRTPSISDHNLESKGLNPKWILYRQITVVDHCRHPWCAARLLVYFFHPSPTRCRSLFLPVAYRARNSSQKNKGKGKKFIFNAPHSTTTRPRCKPYSPHFLPCLNVMFSNATFGSKNHSRTWKHFLSERTNEKIGLYHSILIWPFRWVIHSCFLFVCPPLRCFLTWWHHGELKLTFDWTRFVLLRRQVHGTPIKSICLEYKETFHWSYTPTESKAFFFDMRTDGIECAKRDRDPPTVRVPADLPEIAELIVDLCWWDTNTNEKQIYIWPQSISFKRGVLIFGNLFCPFKQIFPDISNSLKYDMATEICLLVNSQYRTQRGQGSEKLVKNAKRSHEKPTFHTNQQPWTKYK